MYKNLYTLVLYWTPKFLTLSSKLSALEFIILAQDFLLNLTAERSLENILKQYTVNIYQCLIENKWNENIITSMGIDQIFL